MDTQQIQNYLGNTIYNYFKRRVTSTNFHRIGTVDDYMKLARENWSYLQRIVPSLIDESELDERMKEDTDPWTSWDFYCLFITTSNIRLDKRD